MSNNFNVFLRGKSPSELNFNFMFSLFSFSYSSVFIHAFSEYFCFHQQELVLKFLFPFQYIHLFCCFIDNKVQRRGLHIWCHIPKVVNNNFVWILVYLYFFWSGLLILTSITQKFWEDDVLRGQKTQFPSILLAKNLTLVL